jgi:cell division inhibitor SepF
MVYLGLQDDDEYGYDGYGDGHYDPHYQDGGYAPGPGAGPGPESGGYGADARPPAADDAYASPRPGAEGPHGVDVRPIGGAQPDQRSVAVRDRPALMGGEPTVRALPREDQPSGVSISRPGGGSGVVRAVPTTAGKVHVVEPRGFNDAQEVGDRVKANQAVILNLQGSTKELRRRLIDFASGLAYAVGGSMSRVAEAVFLISPVDVELSEEEKERLEARGLYRRD